MTVKDLIKRWMKLQAQFSKLEAETRAEREKRAHTLQQLEPGPSGIRILRPDAPSDPPAQPEIREAAVKAQVELKRKLQKIEDECWTLLGQLAPEQLPLLAAELVLLPEALPLIRIVWGRLSSIDFGESGRAATTARAVLEVLLAPKQLLHDCARRHAEVAARGGLLQDLRPELARLGDFEPKEMAFGQCMERFGISEAKPVLILNRTAIFQTETGFVAFKIQKASATELPGEALEADNESRQRSNLTPHRECGGFEPERVTELFRELVILRALVKHRKALGLRSILPDPQDVLVIADFPLDAPDPKGRQIPLGREGDGGKAIYRWEGDVVIAYVYTTKLLDYFTYLVDPSLDDREFAAARDAGFHDVYRLMRHGLFPTALADLFHARVPVGELASNRQADGGGRYRVLNDLLDMADIGTHRGGGTGKLGTWMAAIEYINLRKSGIADFADFLPLDRCIAEDEWFRQRFFSLLSGEPHHESRLMVNLLAEPLLVYELVMARRYVEKHRMRYTKDTYNDCLGNEMLHGLALALAAYTGCSEALAASLFAATLDARRMGQQMSFFLSTSHAKYFETGQGVAKRLRQLYGPDCEIRADMRSLIAGVTRGGSPHRCLRVGTGSGFSADWHDPDLGPYTGVNPCKETERSRFVFASFALLVREAIDENQYRHHAGLERLPGDRPAAIAQLRRAFACWPFNAETSDQLARALLDDGDEAAAAVVRAEALEVQRKREAIEADLGMLAPVLQPPTGKDRNPRTRLAQIQAVLGPARERARLREQALAAANEANEAKIWKRKAARKAAVELLRQVLAIDPFDHACMNTLVGLLVSLGEHDEANAVKSKFPDVAAQDRWLAEQLAERRK